MKTVTRKRVLHAIMMLQSAALASPSKSSRKIYAAQRLLDDIALKMRRDEVFAAGARARKPIPKFEGRQLGSMESCNFYDGYASTHPNFKNPYRSGR